jgi:predicted nucleotidyltransferase
MAESIAQVDDDILRTIVQRLVDAVHPDRIVLFGSRARGEARPDSDYDVLVVGPSRERLLDRISRLYDAVGAVGAGKDLIWYTQEEVEDWSNVKAAFTTTALREGRVLYQRAS